MRTITEKEYMELIEMLKDSFRKIDEQFNDLREKMNERFDKIEQLLDYQETWLKQIESNKANKSQFNSLLIILEKKEIISSFDKSHILFYSPEEGLV